MKHTYLLPALVAGLAPGVAAADELNLICSADIVICELIVERSAPDLWNRRQTRPFSVIAATLPNGTGAGKHNFP